MSSRLMATLAEPLQLELRTTALRNFGHSKPCAIRRLGPDVDITEMDTQIQLPFTPGWLRKGARTDRHSWRRGRRRRCGSGRCERSGPPHAPNVMLPLTKFGRT